MNEHLIRIIEKLMQVADHEGQLDSDEQDELRKHIEKLKTEGNDRQNIKQLLTEVNDALHPQASDKQKSNIRTKVTNFLFDLMRD